MTDRESGDIWIANTPEEVWQRLITVTEIPTWYDDWDYCEADPPTDKLHVGVVLHLHKRRLPRARTAQCDVVTVERHSLLRWIESGPHRAPLLVEFRLASLREGTTVTHTKTQGTLRQVN